MNGIISIKDNAKIVVDEHASEIISYSPQLYLKVADRGENKSIIPCASSILFTHSDQFFLITAGHVIAENNPENLGILEGNEFFHIRGKLLYINPNQDEKSDKIDLAIFKLSNELTIDLARHYKFLTFKNFLLDHEMKEHDPRYLVVGYPWRSSKLNPVAKTIFPKPFIFLTNLATENGYLHLHTNKQTNIVLQYHQKKIVSWKTNSITKGVNPQGISGCGVWFINKFIYDPINKPPLRLIGIITEQDKNKRLLQATRIDYVNDILVRDFHINLKRSEIFTKRH